MNRTRLDRRRLDPPVQRRPQPPRVRVELFQSDDVVVRHEARPTEGADGRPVRVVATVVVQPSVGQKTNELDERYVMLGAVEQRRPSPIPVQLSHRITYYNKGSRPIGLSTTHIHTHSRLTALFPGLPG